MSPEGHGTVATLPVAPHPHPYPRASSAFPARPPGSAARPTSAGPSAENCMSTAPSKAERACLEVSGRGTGGPKPTSTARVSPAGQAPGAPAFCWPGQGDGQRDSSVGRAHAPCPCTLLPRGAPEPEGALLSCCPWPHPRAVRIAVFQMREPVRPPQGPAEGGPDDPAPQAAPFCSGQRSKGQVTRFRDWMGAGDGTGSSPSSPPGRALNSAAWAG